MAGVEIVLDREGDGGGEAAIGLVEPHGQHRRIGQIGQCPAGVVEEPVGRGRAAGSGSVPRAPGHPRRSNAPNQRCSARGRGFPSPRAPRRGRSPDCPTGASPRDRGRASATGRDCCRPSPAPARAAGVPAPPARQSPLPRRLALEPVEVREPAETLPLLERVAQTCARCPAPPGAPRSPPRLDRSSSRRAIVPRADGRARRRATHRRTAGPGRTGPRPRGGRAAPRPVRRRRSRTPAPPPDLPPPRHGAPAVPGRAPPRALRATPRGRGRAGAGGGAARWPPGWLRGPVRG